jgi:Flp pilus assembly CpaF family ATPase
MPTRTIRVYYSDRLAQRRYACDVEVDQTDPQPIRIGSLPEGEIVLPSPHLPARSASIHLGRRGWSVIAEDAACFLGSRQLTSGQRVAIAPGQELQIAEYTLTLDDLQAEVPSEDENRERLDRLASDLIAATHRELLPRLPRDVALDSREQRDEALLRLEHDIDELGSRLLARSAPELSDHLAGHCLRSELLRELIDLSATAPAGGRAAQCFWSEMVSVVPDLERDLERLAAAAALSLKLRDSTPIEVRLEGLEREFWPFWAGRSRALVDEGFRDYLALRTIKKDLKDIIFGYGPIEDLLRTPTVSEIMVNDSEHIFIEHQNRLKSSGRRFVSDEVTLSIIERIVAAVNRRIDRSQPIVDARLPDGSRINAVIPPLAVCGPCLTIRKFPDRALDLAALVRTDSLSDSAARFLRASVQNRRNLIVSGGTGSGKTTLLNCLSDCIPENERIITVEDTAELRLRHPHVVRLETRDKNLEGQGAYTIRDLVRNALRMRPDRVVVGECRGAEALDMLQAMNTGHDGSLTTIHANSPLDVISRLEVMVQMAADLPLAAIHRQIASGLDLIVHLERIQGQRRVTQISELTGYDRRGGTIRVRDLYRVDPATGGLRPTGCLPSFIAELVSQAGLCLETFYD